MPEDSQPFAEYSCSLGTVIGHEEGSYRIRTVDGRVIGVLANGSLSAANVEADIASPAAPEIPQVQVYAAQQAIAYTDGPTGLRLKTTEYAQAKFTSQVALTRLALSLEDITTATPQTIWDADNVEQTMTTAEFFALMLRYGLHCKAMFDTYAP